MLVIFKSVTQGYELLVCNSIFETTQTWLTTQGCAFQNTYEKGYVRILITEIPNGTLLRLQQKFPADDNTMTVYNAVDDLRSALATGSWDDIIRVTSPWSETLKKESWRYLSEEEQRELKYQSTKNDEKQDFRERLFSLDRNVLLRMHAVLKAAGLSSFKPLSKNTNADLVDKLIGLFDHQEVCLRAALLLATALNQQE
ncbi:hypothetical protein G7B40_039925 [Aetokthonos hydrillicola Thurmond2011]|jgi:hypothetical protein|uniref:Uncharacterized protein n=2 Tax=Aetokthonos TaxID=1550243 RepID=A0AAP5IIL0_9CYAN|nr:hypothetical protein [Aetokthonos hydrillicola]MBW4590109.1 hypothetical protein [Aetokthonos hydrillicola CCALA 1050]MDR9900660.1 hypothetical protein [Aetokthonos hydrillicola Thurmond2011]